MTTREDRERSRQTTPSGLPDTTPQALPSGDYTYVLEIVMNMQVSMGKLIEAVDSLKAQSKDQSDKMHEIRRDVHAAKVVMRVLGGLIVLGGGILAWFISTSLPYLFHAPK
jgi:hypothetical protein